MNLKLIALAAFPIVAALGSSSLAQETASITLKETNSAGSEFCLNVRLDNTGADSIKLNAFGSFILMDDEGVRPDFSIMQTSMRNPSFPINEEMYPGDVLAGWLCWTKPSKDWSPHKIVIKRLMGGPVASLVLTQ